MTRLILFLISLLRKPVVMLPVILLSFPIITYAGDSEQQPVQPDDTHYAAIVKIKNEEAVDSLLKEGVTILRRRENLLLCFIPLKPVEVERVSDNERRARIRNRSLELQDIYGVERIEKARRLSPAMDVARSWGDAGRIHSGTGVPSPYTGRGVVTGICDIGLDPMHVGFIGRDGDRRVKRVVQYRESSGERILLENEDDYSRWATDNPDEWHDTHVAGIMAGSYLDNGYYGMAPDSDIVLTASELSDVGLLCGAEDILEYAVEKGKPAVINMSMANYNGPHDGSSLFSRYLDMIGKEAIVVLSAGNAGNYANTLPYDFTETAPRAALNLYSTDWVQFDMHGLVDIWSTDNTPFRTRFCIYDEIARSVIERFEWQELLGDAQWKVASDSLSSFADERFARYFTGEVSLKGGIDEENGRYRVLMEFVTHTDELSTGPWARYILAVETEGVPGKHADFYADGQFTNFRPQPDGPMPGSLLSFSDLSSGFNLVSVGMFNNRNREPSIAGEDRILSGEPGLVSPYSGYATLIDGRVMPLTVAPGGNVVSLCSGPYLEKHSTSFNLLNARADVGGKSYFWTNCSGTSMSSPFVAGTIACWLEADPKLDIDDVKRIIASSNRHDYPDPQNPRHGCGWFDPYGGLLEVVKGVSGIEGISPESAPRLALSGRALHVWNPGGESTRVDIIDATGIAVISLPVASAYDVIDISALSSGIYFGRISGGKNIKFVL